MIPSPPRPPRSTAGLFEVLDYLAASATFQNLMALALVHGQEGQILTQAASEQSLQDKLDGISATLSGEGGVITTLTTGMAGLRDQITVLTAQVAAGSPVTPEQLTSLDAEAGTIQATAATQLAELTTLATPAPPTSPVSPTSPTPTP